MISESNLLDSLEEKEGDLRISILFKIQNTVPFYRNLIEQIVSLLSDCILQVVVKKLLSSSVKHRYIKL